MKIKKILNALLYIVLCPIAIIIYIFGFVKKINEKLILHKNFLKISGYVTIFAFAVGVTAYISDVASYEIGFRLYADGEPLAVVSNIKEAESAVSDVENYYENLTGTGYDFSAGHVIDYRMVFVKRNRLSDSGACFYALKEAALPDFTSGYGLYVDDALVAAYPYYDGLYALLTGIETDENQKVDGEALTVRIRNNIDIRGQLCNNCSFRTTEEIHKMLTGEDEMTGAADVSAYALDAEPAYGEDVTVSLTTVLAAAPNTVEGDIDFGVVRGSAENTGEAPIISYKQLKAETETLDIPYETVYTENPNYYTDYEAVSVAGRNGLYKYKYEVTYVDGAEESRRLLGTDILIEKRDKVVIKGTKPIPEKKPTGTFEWPVSGKISSTYGSRTLFNSYDFHRGIDIVGSKGTKIKAADGGTVSFADYHYSYGNIIIIDHGNGLQSCYAHLDSFLVDVGDKVYKGQYIGKMGSTGVATGNHLHYEMRQDGETVNPMKYLPK